MCYFDAILCDFDAILCDFVRFSSDRYENFKAGVIMAYLFITTIEMSALNYSFYSQ